MENKKKNKRELTYAIIGVLTLIMSMIGATFAYFTAAATPNTSTIQGQSNDALSAALSLTVTKLNLGGTATSGDNLVPADFGVAAASMTKATTQKAITAKCVQGGYTGCHVYKIVAGTTQAVAAANIKLSLTATKASANTSGTLTPWSYVVYTGTDTTVSALATVPSGSSAVGSFGAGLTDLDIHNGAALTTSGKTYYVMIYISNANSNQNSGTTDARGSYTGTVTFDAGGGQIKTTFT